jgi:SPP1 family predicted phage head-tail adaptor
LGAKIAQLRQRITFQSLARTTDGQGGWTETWTDFKTVWAQVTPSSGKERYFAQRIEENITHKITIRWMEGLTAEMRINFEGRIFQIHSIRRENEERWFLILDAEEGVGS